MRQPRTTALLLAGNPTKSTAFPVLSVPSSSEMDTTGYRTPPPPIMLIFYALYMKNTDGVILGDIVPLRFHKSGIYPYNPTSAISSILCVGQECNEENLATYSRHVRRVATLLTHETSTAVHTLQLTVSMCRIPWFNSRQMQLCFTTATS